MKRLAAGDKINPHNMYYVIQKNPRKHFLFRGDEIFLIKKDGTIRATNDLYFEYYKIQTRDELEKLKLLQRLSR